MVKVMLTVGSVSPHPPQPNATEEAQVLHKSQMLVIIISWYVDDLHWPLQRENTVCVCAH